MPSYDDRITAVRQECDRIKEGLEAESTQVEIGRPSETPVYTPCAELSQNVDRAAKILKEPLALGDFREGVPSIPNITAQLINVTGALKRLHEKLQARLQRHVFRNSRPR